MSLILRGAIIFSAAMLTSIAVPAFAESAPVFDVDSMQQQFDGDVDQAPPQDMSSSSASAPSQEGGTFVPAQQSPQSSSNVIVSNAPVGNIEQRLQHVEQQLDNLQNSENANRIDSLQNQVQSLRGQVEDLSHQLQQAQNEQKSRYTDLDKRLSEQSVDKPGKKIAPGITEATSETRAEETESAKPAKASKVVAATKTAAKTTMGADTAAGTENAKKSLDGQPNVAEEQQIYQTAYNLIKVKKYNEAVDALQGMLKKYPSGQFASNAHYWLGELYGLMGKNDLALNEFDTVVTSYPDSPRVSDAQLKVGLIYSAQSKWASAKSSFKKVINHYPGTASARVASEQLKQIKTAGH